MIPSRTRALHARAAEIAESGAIDRTAPVIATATLQTKAPPRTVWSVLIDLERWPEILPGVSRVELTSTGRPPTAGTEFRWRNDGTPIRSTIRRVAPERELSWTGTALWIIAIHRNLIEPLPDGGCRITSEESTTGAFARYAMPAERLGAQLEGFVAAIAEAAERRDDASGIHSRG